MKYSGTYFDYQNHRFKKNIKFFSTPKGCTIFLSLKGVDPSELWSHARKVHVFFPQKNFMEETQLFYSGYLKYLRMLEEKEIMNPSRKFYLHFMVGHLSNEYDHVPPFDEADSVEIDVFYGYLSSATRAYSQWRDLFLSEGASETSSGSPSVNPRHIRPSDMIEVVHDRYQKVDFRMEETVNFSLEPYYWGGIWDLVVVTNLDRITPKMYSLEENRDPELMFTKKPVNKKDDLTPEQRFALITIKTYCSPEILKDLLGSEDSMEELLKFVTKQGKYEDLNIDSNGYKLQNALSNAYDCFIETYRLMSDEERVSALLGGNENE